MKNSESTENGGDIEGNAGSATFDFLDLPGCTTLRKDQFEHILLVRAFYEQKLPDVCPVCNGSWQSSPEVQDLLPFWDIPRGTSAVLVQLFVPIMLCGACGHRETIELSWLHATRQITFRLEDYILDRAATLSTFTQIALDSGQEVKTVIDIFLLAFRAFDEAKGKNLPRVLGIDEVYFHGKYYTILVDGELNTAVDLLEGRKNDIIEARLKLARNRDAVEFVTQDFYDPYRALTTRPISRNKKVQKLPDPAPALEDSDDYALAALLFRDAPESHVYVGEKYSQIAPEIPKVLLPNAKTVGDHFHFKQKIEDCFDDVRIQVKNSLGRFFLNRLKKTYTSAELANAMFREKLKADAKKLAEDRSTELDKSRKILSRTPEGITDEGDRLRLSKLFSDHPILEKAWHARNRARAIFPLKAPIGRSRRAKKAGDARRTAQLMDAVEVGRRLDAWVLSLDKQVAPHYKLVIKLIGDWREEIIRIGTTPYSNAVAESKNHFLRMLKAISRGLNFELLRARLLWSDTRRSTQRWPDFAADTGDRMTTQRFVKYADACLARNPKEGPSDEAAALSLSACPRSRAALPEQGSDE